MIVGALIVAILIVEPHGMARLRQIAKQAHAHLAVSLLIPRGCRVLNSTAGSSGGMPMPEDASREGLVGAVVVMGVSGCGKSTIGRGIAERLCCSFLEGDELHPPTNVTKMSQGIPLQDSDRLPWLDAVGAALGASARASGNAVGACSALKRAYRDRLSAAAGMPIRYVHLAGTRELLQARMSARTDHFMPTSLLDSQLATLEPLQPDESAVVIDVALPPERQIDAGVEWLERVRRTSG